MNSELEPLNNKDFDIFEDYDPEALKNMIAMFQAQAAELANPEKCSLEQILEMIDEEARETAKKNELEVCCCERAEDFARSLYAAFDEIYAQYGAEKVSNETIIASFYGTAYVTALCAKEENAAKDVHKEVKTDNVSCEETRMGISMFDLLTSRVNIAEITQNAEGMMELDLAANEGLDLWSWVFGYVSTCAEHIRKAQSDEDKFAATMAAAKHASQMGAAFAAKRK